MSFAGKVALVAGAGGGMGLNIANDLLAEGAHVGLADLKAQPEGIREGPGRHRYFQGDLSDEDFVAAVVAGTVADFGRLDYLVNATGVLWRDRDKSLVDMDMAVWDRVMAINLKSHVLTARHAVPEMKKAGGGAMVHISSIDALHGDPKPQDAYGAAKAGVLRISKALAIQFAGDGIRSNAILPGSVVSPMQPHLLGSAAVRSEAARHVPLGRLGTTQDLANACLFLLSDKAAFITGAELIVDGGAKAMP